MNDTLKFNLIQGLYIVLLLYTGYLFTSSYNNMDNIILDGGYETINPITGSNVIEFDEPYVKKNDLIVWKAQLFQTLFAMLVFMFIFILLVKPFWDSLPQLWRDRKK